MPNKITFGLEQVHIAFVDDAAAQQPAWKAPVALPGAVRFAPSPEGNESKFYADNIPFFTVTSNNGYSAELEVTLVPDAVLAEMLGWQIDKNGMLVEIADGVQKQFALLAQISGDVKNRRFVYYLCKAARPDREEKTKGENIEPNSEKLKLTIVPVIAADGKKITKAVVELSDTNAAVYDAFFDAVTVPAWV